MSSDDALREELSAALLAELHSSAAINADNTAISMGIEGSCTDGEAKVDLSVTSDAFDGLNRLKRQKLVNKALEPFLADGGKVHALTMKCRTPAEVAAGK